MKTKFVVLIFIVTSWTGICFGQEDIIIKDQKNNDDVQLVGKFERKAIQKGNFGNYFLKEYQNYHPEKDFLNNLESKIYDFSITIVLATWCHDSKEQVPRFFKILDMLDYDTRYIDIICVDKSKSAGEIDIATLNIERVPTFILYENDLEYGRIIETPNTTLEKDILNIILKQNPR
ncbi:MAG: hypothetical protein K8R68_09320 [Bacteroidales bacterium]|nr:hypothetical protein [Bacteroidales bacterium]